MLRRLAMTTLALVLFAVATLSTTGAANAVAGTQGSVAATTTPSPEPSNPSGPSTATPTAEPTTDVSNPAGTGPANPGTSETEQQEQTRTDVVPWVLAGVAAVIIIALIIWTMRNRRGRDKGISDEPR
jgi:cobalamin biosynthesis Mg chelatase CobN